MGIGQIKLIDMKYIFATLLAMLSASTYAQAVINPGTVNKIAGPGSASVVAPGQLKKDFGVSPKYTAPGQVKKEFGGNGRGGNGKGKGMGRGW